MNMPDIVTSREPRDRQTRVEKELCPVVRAICDAYNEQADQFSQIVYPYTNDGYNGLGKLIEQKLLNKGMSFADIKEITVADLVAAKAAHKEHRADVKFRDPRVGIGPKFGLGYLPKAIESRADAAKAQHHRSRISDAEKAKQEAKRLEDQRVREQIAQRRERWARLDDFERAALIQAAKDNGAIAPMLEAQNNYWLSIEKGGERE